ncbi:histidine kinase [Terrimonas sp. NA20]|uniref:Histidine kinase n=1 Tax=Terrimonas ginsenosidimutans TaxID=2908004 RepID=A0ABS9KV74_9BACT|nr:histidine kinase [Terrimonas ginsenosidimutans]MCG2616198.1 histidine kinase [Terrimonas ginsenosidimutans]
MKKNRLLLYYLLAWALLVAYLYTDNVANRRGSQPYVWSNLCASFIEFSFCFFIVYPYLLRRKKIHLFVLGLIAADALFVGSRYLIEEVIYLWTLGYGNYDPGVKMLHYIGDNWWRALKPIIFSFMAWALVETLKRERETEQLKKERIQAELLFLKTQINPHFLYNTLNYMYAMAYPVSDALAQAIVKLSNLMRYMLHNSVDGMIDLQLEIDYLHNYIGIYKLRFQESFFVDFRVEGTFAGKRVASLMLIPFVENAFKHGVVDDAGKPVTIFINANNGSLFFSVTNYISFGDKDSSGGIGLANIRRRLELIYPNAHELHIDQDDQLYKATLKILLD